MEAPPLKELELWLRNIFICPEGVDAFLQKEDALLPAIVGRAPLSSRDRLEIYAHDYFWRVHDSLKDDFGKVAFHLNRLEGSATFHDVVHAYLQKYPSTSENLADAGSCFPLFLSEHELGKKYPWLHSLSDLEWKALEAFYALDPDPIPPPILERLAGERALSLRFTLSPSVSLVESKWSILGAYRKEKKQPIERRQFLLVHRPEGWPSRVEAISEKAFQCLRLLQEGNNLGYVCEWVEKKGITPELLNAWFTRWMQNRIFGSVLTEETQ